MTSSEEEGEGQEREGNHREKMEGGLEGDDERGWGRKGMRKGKEKEGKGKKWE